MILKGNPVSPGIALGEAYVYEPFSAKAEENYLLPSEIPQALEAYDACRERARAELEAVQEKLRDDPDEAKIFAAHIDILFDEAVDEDVRMMIEEGGASPDWAVMQTYETYMRLLSSNANPMIAERAADIRDVRNRFLRCWAGKAEENLSSLEKPVIVVAHDLAPSDTATLDRDNVLAIVTEIGGATSHSAVIARSYGIPALLGVENAVSLLRGGKSALVDALNGCLTIDPDEETRERAKIEIARYAAEMEEIRQYLDREPVTPDGQRMEIELNIASADPTELKDTDFADGVGLFRTEFLYMGKERLPTEEEQYEVYRKVLLTFDRRPVILRTLDIGGDKQLACMDLPKEENPFLGRRALRLCLDHLPVFETQLRAALRAAVHGNLWIMFPMVGSMDDIRAAKAVVSRVRDALEAEGTPYGHDVKIGIMIEIPSIALIADQVVREVDFASIGTNDLTQYTCAVDRMNQTISGYYQPCHPAMLRLIRYAAQQFALAGKPLGVCGEMASDPVTAAALMGCGVRRLSMGAAAAARIKKLICHLPMEQAKRLSDTACDMSSHEEIRRWLEEEISKLN